MVGAARVLIRGSSPASRRGGSPLPNPCSLLEERINSSLGGSASGINRFKDRLASECPSYKARLDRMMANFSEATDPRRFHDVLLRKFDLSMLDDLYPLLAHIFSSDVVVPREFIESSIKRRRGRDSPCSEILSVRWFTVPGEHEYDYSGRLRNYHYDPGKSTRRVMSFTEGSYMPILDSGFKATGASMAAIGYTATLELFRRKGHGTATVRNFERAASSISRERKERFYGIVCESEKRSLGFWDKKGFLWPVGSSYFQPPIAFDNSTGKGLYNEVRETLDIKPRNGKKTMRRELLTDIVRTIYYYWYAPKGAHQGKADERIRSYVFGLMLNRFAGSLKGQQIHLASASVRAPQTRAIRANRCND